MTTMAQQRKLSVSVNDYPEHLNPFYEEDNHNRIRFWTIGKGIRSRSNSFSLSGFKDFRNTWTLRSFMKKGKKDSQNNVSEKKPSPTQIGNESPIVYRKPPVPQTTTTRNTEQAAQLDRYQYGGSVTPLPRSRFQDRLRSSMQPESNGFSHNSPGRSSFSHRSGEPYALPGLSRCSLSGSQSGSRLSVESVNPFDTDAAGGSLVRASRRKKKRAPPPPPHSANASLMSTSLTMTDISMNSSTINESELSTNNTSLPKLEIDEDDHAFETELKIVEDEPAEEKTNHQRPDSTDQLPDQNGNHQRETVANTITKVSESVKEQHDTVAETEKNRMNNGSSVTQLKNSDQTDDKNSNTIQFDKVNVKLYRQNSKVSQSSLKDVSAVSHPSDLDCELTSLAKGLDTTLHINEDDDVVEARTKEKHVTINDGTDKPQVVICKIVDNRHSRKYSTDNSISSMERDFLEIDRATKELELEINKLNGTADCTKETTVTALTSQRRSVSEMKTIFDGKGQNGAHSPNPIPKPRRSRADLSAADLALHSLPTL